MMEKKLPPDVRLRLEGYSPPGFPGADGYHCQRCAQTHRGLGTKQRVYGCLGIACTSRTLRQARLQNDTDALS